METDDDVQSLIENLKFAIFNAQNEIKSTANNYDDHVKLISLHSELYSIYKSQEDKTPEIELTAAKGQTLIAFNKLRNARKSMAAVYPLSNELWIQWIEDELKVPVTSINHSIIEDIFNKATADYLSVDIWCHFVQYYVSRYASGAATESSVREIFEKAVLNCGLHYQDGNKIWEAYQHFELKMLLEAKLKLQENSAPENIERYKTQLFNLIKIFKRQMHVPLAKNNELLSRFTDTLDPFIKYFKSFSGDSQFFKIEEIEDILAVTLNKIEAESIAVHENHLEESNHSLEAYQSYINHELDAGKNDPARVQCLFERAVVYHCLKPSIWLDYISFLNDVLKQSDLALCTCKRALRNVTWDSRIYVKYAVILEQTITDPDDVRNAYEMGLEKYSNNGFNYCSVWMSYLSFEKRNRDISLFKTRTHIYELIQKALRQLEGLSDHDKFIIDFMIFWMNIEKFWFNDEIKPELVLKYFGIKYRNDYSVWYQIVTFARAMGFKNLVEELFNIGLLEFPDSFEQFGQSWIHFESLFGTLNSYNQLEKKISIHIPFRMQSRKTKESLSLKSRTEHQNKFLIGWLNRAENQLFSCEERDYLSRIPENSSILKRGLSIQEIPHSHRSETSSVNEMNDKARKGNKHVKQMHEDITKNPENSVPVIGPVMPPGFVQSANANGEDNDSGDDDSDENDDFLMPPPKKIKFTEKDHQSKNIPESEGEEYKRTVYVSNLHPSASESDLKVIFGRAGNVENVDIHRQKGGKIFAFVRFSKPEEAQNAFELEHTPIRNRPVFVSKFNRSKDKHTSAVHYSQQQEKNKLFVSNLDKSTMPNDLEKLFNRHGDMASLRLINKKGSSKPFAYVEYRTEEDAARYRDNLNNAIVRGRQISVEFSNPGVVNQSDRQRQLGIGALSYGNLKTDIKKMDVGMIDRPSSSTVINREPTDTASDSSHVGIPKKVSSTPFGFIPMQARQPRNQQPSARNPKVRISVTPVRPISSTASSSNVPEESTAPDDKPAESSASKSNDDFRKILLKKD